MMQLDQNSARLGYIAGQRAMQAKVVAAVRAEIERNVNEMRLEMEKLRLELELARKESELLREWKQRREDEHEELQALREWRDAHTARVKLQHEMLAEHRRKQLIEAWAAERDEMTTLQ
jgi:hypothetical protein